MARRFGAEHSPDGSVTHDHTPPPGSNPDRNVFDGKRRTRTGGRSNLLFFTPIPFVVRAFQAGPGSLVLGIAAAGLLILAAWLTREGIRAQEAYDARRVARRPAFPRKIAGSVLIGAGLVAGGLMTGQGLVYPILFGVIGAGLHFLSFGPDPLTDKGMEGVDSFQTDRVARAVDEAEKHLNAMKDAILRAGDRALEARVDRFATTARALFRTVEGDPRDLTAARKYLGVYLMGARDAAIKFADLYAQSRSPAARADFEALLTDLETNFATRTQALLEDNHSDLDVEIQVLRERLQFENPAP
ncbi:MAG: 5-bromo-4-chloroindolyl phosphate hydrolysis family protein [Paracoccaceae bacterium]|nr:5-bromo-4-chloroindolyl phosphate hydrolysis family protein [Paracoccaceae bacterium]